MRALFPLLALLLACPHDFNRGPSGDRAPVDATAEAALPPDLDPPDAPRPDTLAPPDLPPPDTTCIAPCVQTLPGYFKNPRGVAVDSTGTVYVSESDGHRIWRITGGQATVLTGGAVGYQNGPLLQAQFKQPRGLSLDGAGGIYVADYGNSVVRHVAGGVVDTLAGDGTTGYNDGPAAQARFVDLQDVATDGAGKVFVADEFAHRIRLIEGGVVSPWAGDGTCGSLDGTPATAQFCQPRGVDVDSAGTIYVADYHNHAIRMIKGQDVSTLAGDGNDGFLDGPAGQARFSWPIAVVVDQNGTVYVADHGNHRIRTISVDPAGNATVSTLAGDGTPGLANGPANAARFDYPTGLAVDGSGNVYVADTNNNVVRVIRQY